MLETMRDVVLAELEERYPLLKWYWKQLQAPGYMVATSNGRVEFAVKVINDGVLVDVQRPSPIKDFEENEWAHRRWHTIDYGDPRMMEIIFAAVKRYLPL